MLIGDPSWLLPHPVELMGRLINKLKKIVEQFAKDNHLALRVGGFCITCILITICGSIGWSIERLCLSTSPIPKSIGISIVVISLASTLAAKSLRDAVFAVLKALNKETSANPLQDSRKALSHIVGREVWQLDQNENLRTTKETASENAVNRIIAPKIWMLLHSIL